MQQLGVIVSEEELQNIDRYWRHSDIYKNRTAFVKAALKSIMNESSGNPDIHKK